MGFWGYEATGGDAPLDFLDGELIPQVKRLSRKCADVLSGWEDKRDYVKIKLADEVYSFAYQTVVPLKSNVPPKGDYGTASEMRCQAILVLLMKPILHHYFLFKERAVHVIHEIKNAYDREWFDCDEFRESMTRDAEAIDTEDLEPFLYQRAFDEVYQGLHNIFVFAERFEKEVGFDKVEIKVRLD